jgi:hypothetical protein
MKQTAVEWLIDELTDNGIEYLDLAYEIIEQAKEMEKQQIEKMYSEEEVIIFLQKYRFDLSSGKTPILGDTTKYWFEQFKKDKL